MSCCIEVCYFCDNFRMSCSGFISIFLQSCKIWITPKLHSNSEYHHAIGHFQQICPPDLGSTPNFSTQTADLRILREHFLLFCFFAISTFLFVCSFCFCCLFYFQASLHQVWFGLRQGSKTLATQPGHFNVLPLFLSCKCAWHGKYPWHQDIIVIMQFWGNSTFLTSKNKLRQNCNKNSRNLLT